MKVPRLNDHLTWKNRIHKVVGLIHDPAVVIQSLDHDKCPHCNGQLDPQVNVHVIGSPNFQKEAMPVQTLIDLNGPMI